MIQGLDRIANLLRLCEIRTELCREIASDAYRSAVVDLYSSILEYQARMASHLSDNVAVRGLHSFTRTGQWSGFLKAIDVADQYCQQHEALIDKKAEQQRWEDQNQQMERSIEIQQVLEGLHDILAARAMEQEDSRQREVLHCFTTDYTAHKNCNPRRVPGTCRWFLDDKRFHKWRDSRTSCLLWLTTGPGR